MTNLQSSYSHKETLKKSERKTDIEQIEKGLQRDIKVKTDLKPVLRWRAEWEMHTHACTSGWAEREQQGLG